MCLRGWGGGDAIFCKGVRDRLSDRWFLNIAGTGTGKCKGLESGECWAGKRGPVWLERGVQRAEERDMTSESKCGPPARMPALYPALPGPWLRAAPNMVAARDSPAR